MLRTSSQQNAGEGKAFMDPIDRSHLRATVADESLRGNGLPATVAKICVRSRKDIITESVFQSRDTSFEGQPLSGHPTPSNDSTETPHKLRESFTDNAEFLQNEYVPL